MRRLSSDERGAALVEFSVVAILLLAIMFGVFEIGLAMRDQMTVSNSTQNAIRVVTNLGDDEQADYEALLALEQSLSTLPNAGLGVVKFVTIYKADGSGGPTVPCDLVALGGSPECNLYLYAPGGGCDWNPCPDIAGGGSLGGGWDPTARDAALPGLDVVGLRVYYSHDWIGSGILPLPAIDCTAPPSDCWSDFSAMRIEPAG